MKDWKQKAMTLGRKLHKLREKYSEETKYRKSLEGTIYSLQDQLEDQKQKFVSGINEIQTKYDELQLICRRSKKTSESCKDGLKQTIAVLRNEKQMKMALIQKLELDVVDKIDTINSLQLQMRELCIKCESERCKQRMKNQGTQWDPQQYPVSSISTPKEGQSVEIDIDSDDSEYRISSDIDVESAEFDQEILPQSEQESDALSSNVVDTKMLYKAGGTLKCVDCDQLFEKHSLFINHTDAEHDIKKPYRCSDCAKCYGTKAKLTYHINNIHAPRYECGVCHKRFGQQSTLKRHSVYHSEERPFKCLQCTSSFKQRGNLSNHIRMVHQKEKRFQCTICSKAFSAKGALTVHQRSHTGEQPFQCTVCNKTFTQRAHLKIHEVIHRDERPFQCSQCDSAFKQIANLTTHVRSVHQKEKRFRCDHCSKGFFHKGGLIKHSRVHTGERPFKCPQCDSSFKLKQGLSNHIRRVHKKEKRFHCDHCSKGFFNKQGLTAHVRVHTGERPYECCKCHMAFTQSGHMKLHEKKCHH